MVPLPSSGPERSIFLQALRTYADGCDAPDLTPGCPYFRVDSTIGPYCGEECMDLLGRYPVEARGVQLDGTFRAVRLNRRARRPPRAPSAAFDAKQLFLEDEERPLEEWRSTSLLVALRNNFLEPPASEGIASRARRVDLIVEELEGRGVAADRIVRSMFLQDRARVVVLMSVLPLMMAVNELRKEQVEELAEFDAPVSSEWRAAVLGDHRSIAEWYEIAVADGPERVLLQVARLLDEGTAAAHSWFISRTFGEVLAGAAPPPETYRSLLKEVPPTPTDDDLWVVDRFTSTYLADWNQESLLREYRYHYGECEPPCRPAEMRSRSVSLLDLTAAIAQNASRGRHGRRTALRTSADLVPSAIRHLEDGNVEMAAAIFDAQRRAFPDDFVAHNNYGFCMMPTDGEKALAALERAAETGMGLAPVNVANRLLLLRNARRFATALQLAERAALSTAWAKREVAYLWDPDSTPGEWKVDSVEARGYIAELAIAVAREAGDAEAARMWTTRRETLDT